jgi:acyl carrier protein
MAEGSDVMATGWQAGAAAPVEGRPVSGPFRVTEFRVTEDALCRAVRRVLAVDRDRDDPVAPDSRLDQLGLDSLLLAETIVELEEELGVLLELRPRNRMETVRDLEHALFAIEPPTTDERAL